MKLLIAVKSCHQHKERGYHDVIRRTWGQHCQPKFFVGLPFSFEDNWAADEVIIQAGDDYLSLPGKTQAILHFSLRREYDFTFLCDNDTFIVPHLLMLSGFAKYDYAGHFNWEVGRTYPYAAVGPGWQVHQRIDNCYPWASGGVGYFVSRKAAEIISEADISSWAEDLWVGQVLGKAKVDIGHLNIEGRSAWHFPKTKEQSTYTPETDWMQRMENRYGSANS